MRKYIEVIKKIVSKTKDKKVLGRWNTEYCNQKIQRKVDLSNEDHCGPCGQYILQQQQHLKNTKLK